MQRVPPSTEVHLQGVLFRAVSSMRAGVPQRSLAPVRCSQIERSYDSEDELNGDFLQELSLRTDPDKFDRFSKRMDLMWRMSKVLMSVCHGYLTAILADPMAREC